jgi:CheY-like chemotaxis protein
MSRGYGWKTDEPDGGPWRNLIGSVPSVEERAPTEQAATEQAAHEPTAHEPTAPPTPALAPMPANASAGPIAGSVPKGRVLIVDDEPFFAQALADMLMDEGFDVVGVVGDGEQAIEATRSLEPQVVLMDLRMPGLDGIEASRVITREFPIVQVLMLSAYEETSLRQEASLTGVFCYLVKGCRPELVIDMVRKALDRHDLLSRRAVAQAQREAESA